MSQPADLSFKNEESRVDVMYWKGGAIGFRISNQNKVWMLLPLGTVQHWPGVIVMTDDKLLIKDGSVATSFAP